jgi:hypothetical protein
MNMFLLIATLTILGLPCFRAGQFSLAQNNSGRRSSRRFSVGVLQIGKDDD